MRKKRFKRIIICVFLATFSISYATKQNPQKTWQQYKTPNEAGFSLKKLKEAKNLYDSLGAAAYLLIFDGKVVISWGDVERRYKCHSIRKSLLSGLYGIHVEEGNIDLNKTLGELKIDDKSSLTQEEKKATVKDLLKARSGVYHTAAYESLRMKATRPKRGSHKHDTFWYYNNWDFNVLCTILIKETGKDFFEEFKKRIAEPLQMEDFRIIDCYYHLEPENSIHPAYPFRMSARDLARFGLLYLRKGCWNEKQIISKKWINESTSPYSQTDSMGGGYSYLWWNLSEFKELGVYAARGYGGHVIAVVPGANIVIVQRVDTYLGKSLSLNRELFQMILDAKISEPKPRPKLIPLQNTPSYKRPKIKKLKPEVLDKYVKDYPMGDVKVTVTKANGDLIVELPTTSKFRLLPLSETKFVMEDLEQYIIFEQNNKGIPFRLKMMKKND